MPSDDARRGRPKGSGLDDSSQLRRVADLLEADPHLKPTTAIKAIGVSDPSTIRRLREKLKVEPLRSPNGGAAESPRGVQRRSASVSTVRRHRLARGSRVPPRPPGWPRYPNPPHPILRRRCLPSGVRWAFPPCLRRSKRTWP